MQNEANQATIKGRIKRVELKFFSKGKALLFWQFVFVNRIVHKNKGFKRYFNDSSNFAITGICQNMTYNTNTQVIITITAI